jgi:general stress protein 26
MAAHDIDRVWDIIEKVHTSMLTTRFAGGLRARPLDARPDRDEGVIWFVTDARAGKDDEIGAIPDVCLTFVDVEDKAYLSISGRASVTRDPAKTAEIWKKMDEVWWPGGPDDPNVRVVRVEPHTAELWDGPGTVGAAFEFAKWRITGEKPNVGEERKKTVTMG